jgi:hypothetical protein
MKMKRETKHQKRKKDEKQMETYLGQRKSFVEG